MIITVTNYFDLLGSKQLNNRCPDCGKPEALELSFYQKRIESAFSTKVTGKVSGILYCHHTNTEISPVQWSDEIERIFNTEKQRLKLQPKRTKFNKWFYALITAFVVIAITIVSFFIIEVNDLKAIQDGVQNVKVGDKFEVFYSNTGLPDSPIGVYTWFLVKKIDGNSIWLQRHKKLEKEDSESFDLITSNFTHETLEASLKDFKKRSLISSDYSKHQFTGLITKVKSE